MRMRKALAVLAITTMLSPALAEDGQWDQVTNLPKGLNLPQGVAVSVLGIEPGAGIEEVRAITAKLLEAHEAGPELTEAEKFDLKYSGGDMSPPLQEFESGITVTMPGGDRIDLGYVGRIDLKRNLSAAGGGDEYLRIDLSAPSSGNQVMGVQRHIKYYDDTKQPRFQPLLDELTAKLGEPMVQDQGSLLRYRWQFDAGNPVHRAEFGENDCWPYIGDVTQRRDIDDINTRSGGDCDVVFEMTVYTGISSEHASSLAFELSDNERGRANLTTDFAFFDSYVERYQDSVNGVTPAL